MSRYIEYEPIMEELEKEVKLADDWKTAHEIANVVKYAPSIDIVRCKECAKWRSDRFFCTQWSCGTPAVGWCYMAKQTERSE